MEAASGGIELTEAPDAHRVVFHGQTMKWNEMKERNEILLKF